MTNGHQTLRRAAAGAALTFLLTATPVAHALKGGLDYPIGGVDSRTAMLPPPGQYFFSTLTYSSSNRFNDNNGNRAALPTDFKIKYPILSLGALKVWDTQLAGGTIGSAIVVPISLDSTVEYTTPLGSASGRKRGLGKVAVEPLTWSRPFPLAPDSVVFWNLSAAFHLPTNNYNENDVAQFGTEATTFQPYTAVTWRFGQGWDLSGKLSFHRPLGKYKQADYRDGDVVTFEYGVSRQFGVWTVGLNGYSNRQVSDDERAGVKVADNNYRADAIGPFVGYDILRNGKPWANVVFKVHQEYRTTNNPQIGTKLGVKFAVPF